MSRLSGLYVITADTSSVEDVASAIEGGASIVQYRDKSADASARLNKSEALRRLCSDTGTLLIINDDVELAATVGADGVHLGRIPTAPAPLNDSVKR